MTAAKILFVDDEPDVELLMKQRFRKQVRQDIFELIFAQNGDFQRMPIFISFRYTSAINLTLPRSSVNWLLFVKKSLGNINSL